MATIEQDPKLTNPADESPERRPAPDENGESVNRMRKHRTPKAQLFVTICHWSMVILVALNLLTGMRIGWGNIESPLGGTTGLWSAILAALSPRGTLLGVNLITLHVTLAFFMFAVVGVYFVYLFWSRASRKMRVTSRDLEKLRDGVSSGDFWHNKAALWTANLLVYWASLVILGVLFVTGLVLYYPELAWGPFSLLGGYPAFRFLHALFAYVVLPYTIIHAILQWVFGRFWTIFKAQLYRPHIRAGVIGLIICLPSVGVLYAWNEVPTTLTVARVPDDLEAPVLDGDASDPVWRRSDSVTIRTVKGVNNPDGHVDVTVKGVHDGEQIYFQFRWKDLDVSYKRFPLRKTWDGWEVLQTAFSKADENVYYEDKLAMYITDVPMGSCAATCHLGSGPHSKKGDKHGLHYTDGEIGDVWHWKSVRTNYMSADVNEPGYMDDQRFGPPDPVPAELKKRYTAGYHPDPKTGGGYRYNFEKLSPDKPLTETFVQPVMLPPNGSTFTDPDPATHEQGVTWRIHKSEGIPYSEEADKYPVGALIPNIVIDPFQGDRADIRARGAWHDGYWTLEARRVLDTGSKNDVAFSFDRPVYISVSPFNRSQTRHGEHIRPVRLDLQKGPAHRLHAMARFIEAFWQHK